MELRELHYFIVIAEEKSISRAADKLHMAQSSLSKFLKKFEYEMNVKLFMRTSSGVRPTYSGEVFLKNAKQIIQQYHLALNELWDIENLKTGRIELGISTFRGSYLLPKVLMQFKHTYPNVQVIIHEHNSIILNELVSNSELDMALVAYSVTPKGVAIDQIMQDEVLIVANTQHEIMKRVKHFQNNSDSLYVDLEDTADFEFLLSERNSVLGNTANKLFAQHNLQPKVINTNLTARFAAAMARQGLGLAFTYHSCAEPRPNTAYISIGKNKKFINIALEYPESDYCSQATRKLSQLLIKYYSADTLPHD